VRLVVLGALIALTSVACGADAEDESATTIGAEDVCAARDDLDAELAAMSEIDVVAEGTDAVRANAEAVSEDVDAIIDVAGESAADEVDELRDARNELTAAVTGAAYVDNAEAAEAISAAIGDLVDAIGAVSDAAFPECDEPD
jgi:hypothetical protein